MMFLKLINKNLNFVSLFVKFCSTTDLSPTKIIKSNSFKKSLKNQELVSISGKEIFDQYSFFSGLNFNSKFGSEFYDLDGLDPYVPYCLDASQRASLRAKFDPLDLENARDLELHIFEHTNPLGRSDTIIRNFSSEYFYFKKELDFVISYDMYNKGVNSKLTVSQDKMVYSFHFHFSRFLNNFKDFFFFPLSLKIIRFGSVGESSEYMKPHHDVKLLFDRIVINIQQNFQSKGYTDEMDVCPIEKWDLVNVLRNSLYQYAFDCCWKAYAKLYDVPVPEDEQLSLRFEVMDRKADFLRHKVSCPKTLEAAASLDILAEKYILNMLTWSGQLLNNKYNIERRKIIGGGFVTDIFYFVKPITVRLFSGIKLPYLRQPSNFMVREEFNSLSQNMQKVVKILHSTSFFINPIFNNVMLDILRDPGYFSYSEAAKLNSLNALEKHSEKHSISITIKKVVAILKHVLFFRNASSVNIIYSRKYFFDLAQKDWEFILESRKQLNSFFKAQKKAYTSFSLSRFSKILEGYRLFFKYTLDSRLRLHSKGVFFSKDSGIFKFSTCGPILPLTDVGFLALFKCYFSYGDNSKENFSRIEECFISNNLDIVLASECFSSLKYVKFNSPDYLLLKFLENTITAALNTSQTGFLMPLDQKNSVWMFVGLFFRNSKILSLTSVIQNEYKMDLIQYLQSQNEGFSEIVLRTQKKSKFFKENDVNTNELVANSIRKFIKLFSEKRSLHKSLSMFSVFGQMAAGRRDELEKLVQNELGKDKNLTKEDREALKRIAGGYNEFLNKYLDGIMTHINSFKQLSHQYFEFKFLYLKNEIEVINEKLKDLTSLEEYEVKRLQAKLKTLEKDQALYFKNVNGDLIYHQETSWLESSRDRHSLYSHHEKTTKSSDTRAYSKKINTDSKEASHQIPSAMIHSMEAAILHDVILKLDDKGIRINHCHDCYLIHPNFYSIFFEVMSDVYQKQFGSASTFWDLSTILVNREGIYWLEDPVLTSQQRLELEKMMANFMKSFNFTMDSSWTFKNVKECYVFDR